MIHIENGGLIEPQARRSTGWRPVLGVGEQGKRNDRPIHEILEVHYGK